MSIEHGLRRGLPLVICAPSGAGKSTLVGRLTAEFPMEFSISCTTRKPRGNEKDGVDYIFLDRETFLDRRGLGYFAEWAEVHGNFYGTPLKPVQDRLAQGRDMLFDIDVQGAAQLSLSLPEARFVFILPPSLEELERRLRDDAKAEGRLVDVSQGRKTRAILVTDSNHVILSAISADTLGQRFAQSGPADTSNDYEDEDDI